MQKDDRSTPRYTIIELSKKGQRQRESWKQGEETHHAQAFSTRLTAHFSSEMIEARRHGDDIVKELKVQNCQPRVLQAAKVPFKNEREIKWFPGKQRQRICH